MALTSATKGQDRSRSIEASVPDGRRFWALAAGGFFRCLSDVDCLSRKCLTGTNKSLEEQDSWPEDIQQPLFAESAAAVVLRSYASLASVA
eukprot:5204907-Amphidinium_carterae.1